MARSGLQVALRVVKVVQKELHLLQVVRVFESDISQCQVIVDIVTRVQRPEPLDQLHGDLEADGGI